MKHIILLLLLGTIGQCYAETYDVDTIDNWQIYNGKELVLAGHDLPLGTAFNGTIKKTELKALTVHFNHCIRYTDGFDVIIDIADENGKNIVTKKFKVGSTMTIDPNELAPLKTKSITIRYRENRKDGTNKILGQISFV